MVFKKLWFATVVLCMFNNLVFGDLFIEGDLTSGEVSAGGSFTEDLSGVNAMAFQLLRPLPQLYLTHLYDAIQQLDKTHRRPAFALHDSETATTTLSAVSARMIDSSGSSSIFKQDVYQNPSSIPVTVTAEVSTETTNSVEHSWNNANSVSAGVGVEVSFLGFGSASASLDYSHEWGSEETVSESTTIGYTNGIELELQPGQMVEVLLTATRSTAFVEVDYELALEGGRILGFFSSGNTVDYFDSKTVLAKAGLPTVLPVTEEIEFGFVNKVVIIVQDYFPNNNLRRSSNVNVEDLTQGEPTGYWNGIPVYDFSGTIKL